jgi:hypothetical protein
VSWLLDGPGALWWGGWGLAVLTVPRLYLAALLQFYQRLRPGEVNEQYLWDQRLLPLLGYLTADQTVKVREALSLAYDAHSGQQRKSGEPFITHPVEVTRILAELKMDYECLVAGALHWQCAAGCWGLESLQHLGGLGRDSGQVPNVNVAGGWGWTPWWRP